MEFSTVSLGSAAIDARQSSVIETHGVLEALCFYWAGVTDPLGRSDDGVHVGAGLREKVVDGKVGARGVMPPRLYEHLMLHGCQPHFPAASRSEYRSHAK